MIPSLFLWGVLQKFCLVQTSQKHGIKQFWHSSISKRVQLPAIRITEQPILLTEREINRPGYKFSNYFVAKNGHSNLVLSFLVVLKSEGPYFLIIRPQK